MGLLSKVRGRVKVREGCLGWWELEGLAWDAERRVWQ